MVAAIQIVDHETTLSYTMKRTRRLAKAQSKHGCVTCKLRKVRCDETHPTCQRCTNAGFVCEGYPNPKPEPSAQGSSSQQSWSTTIEASKPSIPPRLDTTEPDFQQKLISLLLSNNIAYIGRHALISVLRMTPQPAPSTLTAIPALEILTQRDSSEVPNDPASRLKVDTAYGEAIRLFVDEIRRSSGDVATFFLTGTVLIAIELLQRRYQDAWKHLLGSHQSLTASIDARSADIKFLYRVYDLQNLLYHEGVRPFMTEPQTESGLEYLEARSLPYADLERKIIGVLHSAHAFIAELHRRELLETLPLKPQIEEELCRAAVLLATQFIDHSLREAADSSPIENSALLILRNLCLLTTIELDQIRAENEMSWDRHSDEFQSIIEAAENIQAATLAADPRHIIHDEGSRLTLQVGLLRPLLLTALKYRHPLWRRRATACLRQAGIEGPFVGIQLAAMADRCIEIEESGLSQSSASSSNVTPSNTMLNVGMPTEHDRLAYCGPDEDNDMLNQNSWPGVDKGTTTIKFIVRKQPGRILSAKLLTSSYFKTTDEYRKLPNKELDTTTWHMWTELVDFDGSRN